MNAELAQHVLDELSKAGVAEICVCPGGRNAPFVELLAAESCSFRVIWHFEERAAAFFAMGRARATGKPVAICTTSGTAAGELLPAAMEARYSGSPLVLLTADRPRRFRGSGAPQAAEQQGVFGVYAASAFDLAGDERLDLRGVAIEAPMHINVCFEEPGSEPASTPAGWDQAPAPDPNSALEEFLGSVRNPVVLVGGLEVAERSAVIEFIKSLGAPVYAEATSGIRESEFLAHLLVQVGDRILERAADAGYPVDAVLRIGSVPTLRLWRDLEDRQVRLPVASVSRLAFSGLGRESILCCGVLSGLLDQMAVRSHVKPAMGFVAADQAAADMVGSILKDEPASEPGMFLALSERIEPGATVYLGNSLPIREWDFAATRANREFNVLASRGLNGIDGQLSTFLGSCQPGRANWAILGDLTALYDLAGPWVKGQLELRIQATIVVVNNGGGRIFDRMFRTPEFQNEHRLGFARWARMWGLGYQICSSVDQIAPSGEGFKVVELRPSAKATARFWKRYQEALA